VSNVVVFKQRETYSGTKRDTCVPEQVLKNYT